MLLGLRAGLSNKEIADKLQLSEVTVKHHRQLELCVASWARAILVVRT